MLRKIFIVVMALFISGVCQAQEAKIGKVELGVLCGLSIFPGDESQVTSLALPSASLLSFPTSPIFYLTFPKEKINIGAEFGVGRTSLKRV